MDDHTSLHAEWAGTSYTSPFAYAAGDCKETSWISAEKLETIMWC